MSAAALQVEDIHKSFGRLEVLRGISLKAHDGDVIAILGSSGSGKSTFLRCINLLEQPDQGAIQLRGKPLDLVPDRRGKGLNARDARQLAAFRARVGFVFQGFNLWPHLTVLGNVMEAPVHVKGLSRAEARERGLALLDKVGIADKRDSYPSHLSGGQQQRAAIARALAMDPEVILFDEPTSALDPELVAEVLGVIRALAEEGRTMLIVTHEMGFAREVASEVVFLHQGRIEEQGPPSQIFHQPRTERARQFLAKHLTGGA
ncbi:ABC transporter ATP-binding protein [Pararhodospirillum oryzae]|uniref:Histidine/lysine/arginine/ornithine ABC transporter ATP-binding protein HisP n=1 Tax=Pararhodospirillum oryzae TaxID=478448 RepID=A0A512H8I5_9PROT|nr:ATP-binding cassette domain-containing protein [Pararhodospirillum oryzae]GEO81764.1 histidine/lysine/arginine/ornithine ABC transporter ATP-binding protein HisP [Pararhodospirillum oryzae]